MFILLIGFDNNLGKKYCRMIVFSVGFGFFLVVFIVFIFNLILFVFMY